MCAFSDACKGFFARLGFGYLIWVLLCVQVVNTISSTVEILPSDDSLIVNEDGALSSSKTQPPWKERFQKFVQVGTSSTVLAGLAGSSAISMSAAAAAYVEREQKLSDKAVNNKLKKEIMDGIGSEEDTEQTTPMSSSSKGRRRFRPNRSSDQNFSYKSPFEVNDEAFAREGGKLISGSFGVLRRSIGLIGDTVRIVGDTTAGLTGSSIKVMGTAVKSVSSGIDSLGDVINGDNSGAVLDDGNVVDNTRSVAGKSIKLIGSIVRGVGDSIVMAGHATETVASSSIGVAEDAVRIFESLAHSLSTSFSPDAHIVVDDSGDLMTDDKSRQENNNYISYGTSSFSNENNLQSVEHFNWYDKTLLSAYDFFAEVMADSEGIASPAPQFLGIFVILCIFTLKTVNRTAKLECMKIQHNEVTSKSNITEERSKVGNLLLRAKGCWSSKQTIIIVVHILSWLYLCHLSMVKSRSIMRNAEARGFRNAIYSMELSSDTSTFESTLWLNSLLYHIWRVTYSLDSTKIAQKLSNYPLYIKNAMNSSFIDKNLSLVLAYGGLEPYLSEIVGSIVVESLKTDEERPSDVAYVSLDSFTFGSQPPLIRGIKIVRSEDVNTLNMKLDVDALLSDLSVVLMIKLSSLDRAILPSTKISINTVDVKLPLDISLNFRDKFPFVSTLRISLSEMPKLKVKITPLSEGSGLKGVDLGSLPLLDKWIQDSIDYQLLQYVSPRFVAIDLPSLLGSDLPKDCRTVHVIPPVIDIISPVRKTRQQDHIDENQASSSVVRPHKLTLSSLPAMPKLRKTVPEGRNFLQSSQISPIKSKSSSDKQHLLDDDDMKSKKKPSQKVSEKSHRNTIKIALRSLGVIIKRSIAPLVVAVSASTVVSSLNNDNK